MTGAAGHVLLSAQDRIEEEESAEFDAPGWRRAIRRLRDGAKRHQGELLAQLIVIEPVRTGAVATAGQEAGERDDGSEANAPPHAHFTVRVPFMPA